MMMQLILHHSSWSQEFCLSVPVVLGTVGLRRQTINSYLLQTPRGSALTAPQQGAGEGAGAGAPEGAFTRRTSNTPSVSQHFKTGTSISNTYI